MEGPHLHSRAAEVSPEAARSADRPEPVVQHPDMDPFPGTPDQQLRKAPSGGGAPGAVGSEVDPLLRLGDRLLHCMVGVRPVDQELDPVPGHRPATGSPVDGAGNRLLRVHHPGTGHCAPRPSAFSWGRRALRTNPMCSSSGTPSSSAPLITSSRLTPRAKALSLSFFLTLETSRSCRLREGRTRAQATRKPASSSTAKRARAMGVSRGTPL